MKRLSIGILLSAILLSVACNEELIIDNYEGGRPVVEALMFPNKGPVLKITELIYYDEDYTSSGAGIDGLEVCIRHDSVSYILTDTCNCGVYVFNDPGLIIAGESYTMNFVYHEQLVTAATRIPMKPENYEISLSSIDVERIEEGEWGMPSMETIEISWDNPDNEYFFMVTEYLESDPDIINGNFSADDFETTTITPIMTSNYHQIRTMQLPFFGRYRFILFKVNQEYADLFEQVNQTSSDLTDPLTNVENAWGIFTGINADTLDFRVNER